MTVHVTVTVDKDTQHLPPSKSEKKPRIKKVQPRR